MEGQPETSSPSTLDRVRNKLNKVKFSSARKDDDSSDRESASSSSHGQQSHSRRMLKQMLRKSAKDSANQSPCDESDTEESSRPPSAAEEDDESSGGGDSDDTPLPSIGGGGPCGAAPQVTPRRRKNQALLTPASSKAQSMSEHEDVPAPPPPPPPLPPIKTSEPNVPENMNLEGIFEKWGNRLKESSDKMQKYFQRNNKMSDMNRRLKSQIWSSVVTIVLIDAKNLLAMDIDGSSDPYVKFRLGQEKYKSKVIYKSLNPSWLEQFDLHLYDDQNQELEVTVWDKDRSKDDFIGKCMIDLSQLEREKTHKIRKDLDDGAGSIFLLLTISGTTASETISDLTTFDSNPREREILLDRYALARTFHNLRDVGHLTVRVYKAQGLAAADLGGKSDPFCVLELVNARLQTQTEYKTLTPSWQKIFTFNVKDIHSVLEVTVYDEDKDHKVEFLGKLAIPLIRIRNGEKKWYALKDKKLYGRAKGNAPQILLEMDIVWNPARACIRTLNPKEKKYMHPEVKFKRQVFVRNVMRIKAIIMWFIDIGKIVQQWLEWESTIQSILALVVFVLLCHYFHPYMVPLGMLLIYLKCYVVQTLTGSWATREEEDEPTGDDDDDEDGQDKEEKKSLKEKLQAIQEVTQTVQNSIGYIASLGEQVKNTFNFTVPFLSYLAIFLTAVIGAILYWVPMRYLIMAWGINKFARKLIRPHTVPNNEFLDLLSRVPDNDDLIAFRELKVQQTTDVAAKRDVRKKPKGS